MIAQLACCLVLSTLQQEVHMVPRADLKMPPGSQAQLYVQYSTDPLDPPQKSPKKFGADSIQWLFPWMVTGYSHPDTQLSHVDIRFHVFSQEQKGNRALAVTQMYLRLWEYNFERLKLVHDPKFHNGLGLIDVYLCFGGQAGGEQLLGTESVTDPRNPAKTITYPVNTIYIYDTGSFTDPVEMAREVAHEYGHASWPHFGGFKEPEEWAEGYLAEKVYLRWMRDSLAKGELTPEDAMGATKVGLDAWIAKNVDPLVLKAAQVLPTPELLSDPSANGMDAFLGVALFVEQLYPDSVFARSLKLSGSVLAKDYPDGVVLAAEEPAQVILKIPAALRDKSIWIPLGTGKLRGAPILKSAPNGWVQIRVGANPIVVDNPHQ